MCDLEKNIFLVLNPDFCVFFYITNDNKYQHTCASNNKIQIESYILHSIHCNMEKKDAISSSMSDDSW